ncbi:heme o synthase [Aciduricibacillus chroicocephali]|uniref:Protoheme IX farnesyltransferase n=1 Tax=Aciduricibacillus chroicocephali TaxID=3054939 RepID=A0ABY9KZ92_9BACI|nr:heme o synthase [Bacillaceae bacterium 44XB]
MKKTAAVQVASTQGAAAIKSISLFSEIKLLVKGIVLVMNVLPVFVGFVLALYFTHGSLSANIPLFILTMAGSTLVMAGALILNNWYEADLDEKMDRTKKRPTVTGTLQMNTVLWLGIGASVLGMIMMLFTTMEAALYAFIGWFVYVVLYTFWSKRRFTLNTVIGSVSGAVTPLIGWAAISSSYHIIPVMISIILFIWQIPHTFAIAMRRYDDYKAAGVPMLPVVYGFGMTKRQMFVYVAALLPLPFFMTSLGTAFVIVATILNIGFLFISGIGFVTKNDHQWANGMFRASLIYLTLLFMALLVVAAI